MMETLMVRYLLALLGAITISCLTVADYQGSQAYNHSNHAHVSVNTAAGTFHFSYPLIETSGIHAPFKVNLTYRFNAIGRFGLPHGWELDLNYINNGTAFIGGQQWPIDPLWHDEHLFASGLKYYNQHGTRFYDTGVEQEIPEYPTLNYRYKSEHKDGGINYFSEHGLLVLQLDRFGNRILIEYEEPTPSVKDARLRAITDNYNNRYTFKYEPNLMIAHHPDGTEQRVYFNDQGVSSITNQMKQRYEISYLEKENRQLINTISTPLGLITTLEYGSIAYLGNGGQGSLPVVTYFKQYESATDKVHHEAYYQHSVDKNYTGYPLYALSDTSDSLMDSNDQNYRYTVAVKQSDGNLDNPVIHHKIYEYNYLHLPVTIRTLKNGNNFRKTELTYLIDPFKYNRSTNYDKPAKIEHFTWSKKEEKYLPGNRIEHSYDLFGNIIRQDHWVYHRPDENWRHIKTLQHKYFTNHFSLKSETIHNDWVGAKAIKIRYHLSSSKKTHRTKMSYHLGVSHLWQPWQQVDYQYDNAGRETFQQLKWLTQKMPGVQRTYKKTRYLLDRESGVLTVEHENSLGDVRKVRTDTRNQHILSRISALGETEAFQYNDLGQLVRRIDPAGNVYTIEHYHYDRDGLNATVAISPLGFRQREQRDSSGRIIMREESTGDQYQTTDAREYNAFGKIAVHKNRYGYSVTYQYDDQMRLIHSNDPWLNKTTLVYDDDELSQYLFLNGRKLRKQQKTPWLLTTLTTQYGLNDDAKHRLIGVEKKVVKNGFDQIVAEESTLLDSSTRHSTIKQFYTYDPSHNRIKHETQGFDGTVLIKTTAYDLFNNLHTFAKLQTKDGQHSCHRGDRYFYSSDNKLKKVVSPRITEPKTAPAELSPVNTGKMLVFSHKYDKNGREIAHKLPNSRSIHKTYDSRGLLKAVRWTRNDNPFEVRYDYDADRRLVKMTDTHGQQQSYQYDLRGNITALTYPDNKQQTYRYDRMNRVIHQENPSGRMVTYQYKAQDKGKLSSINSDNNSISFSYGEDNNGTRGQLLTIYRNTGAIKTTEHYSYDPFARVNQTEVTTENGAPVYANRYTFLPHGELMEQTTCSRINGDPISAKVSYGYDALKRLIYEKHHLNSQALKQGENNESTARLKAIQYQYDGNNNLLKEQHSNDTGDHQTTQLTYNNINQLTSQRVSNKQGEVVSKLAYDVNGHIVTDHLGNHYEYDDVGLLQSVTTANGKKKVRFEYLPSGLLGHMHTDTEHHTFYYDLSNKAISVVKNQRHYDLIQHKSKYLLQLHEANADQLFVANNSTGAQLGLSETGGQSLAAYSYEGYGQSSRLGGFAGQSSSDFLWNQELSEQTTKAVYLKNRFYHPDIKRFISRDHLQVDNRYSYAHANPILFIDPTGKMPKPLSKLGSLAVGLTMLAIGIISTVAAIPSGGTLTLAAAGGIGGGVLTFMSGVAMMSSQTALSYGNKALALALQIVGGGIGLLGSIVGGFMAIAPTIADDFGSEESLIHSIVTTIMRPLNKPAEDLEPSLANWENWLRDDEAVESLRSDSITTQNPKDSPIESTGKTTKGVQFKTPPEGASAAPRTAGSSLSPHVYTVKPDAAASFTSEAGQQSSSTLGNASFSESFSARLRGSSETPADLEKVSP